MIKKIKLFVNNTEDKAINLSKKLEEHLINNGFTVVDSDFDLAIALGGDGSFLHMVRNNNLTHIM